MWNDVENKNAILKVRVSIGLLELKSSGKPIILRICIFLVEGQIVSFIWE